MTPFDTYMPAGCTMCMALVFLVEALLTEYCKNAAKHCIHGSKPYPCTMDMALYHGWLCMTMDMVCTMDMVALQ